MAEGAARLIAGVEQLGAVWVAGVVRRVLDAWGRADDTTRNRVLTEAIAAGGSTLRDFKHHDGELGYFQHRFAVYDREGQPCPRKTCKGTKIRRIVQSNRSTFYCPNCQR